ncbi:ATP-binding protein [candidate division KSB1 bacterium]|nr:ATP-binding protein [candidate division KSB1 bacterium]
MNAAVTLAIKSTLDNVRLIGSAVKGISSLKFHSVRECNYIETAVVEALTNIVRHAYQYNPEQLIEIIIEITSGTICFTIRDEGLSFDPEDAEPLSFDPNDVENLPEDGMGIFIFNSIMDEVHYMTMNGKNQLRLVKYTSE